MEASISVHVSCRRGLTLGNDGAAVTVAKWQYGVGALAWCVWHSLMKSVPRTASAIFSRAVKKPASTPYHRSATSTLAAG